MKREKGTKLVLYCEKMVVELVSFSKVRVVARKLFDGGTVFCMTSFFSNQIKFRQGMNI